MTLKERQMLRNYFEQLENHYKSLASVAIASSNGRLQKEYQGKIDFLWNIWIGLWKRIEITDE